MQTLERPDPTSDDHARGSWARSAIWALALCSLTIGASSAASARAAGATDVTAVPPSDAVVATPAPQALLPFQASYSWYWHGVRVAVSDMSLEHRADGTWAYSSSASPRGIGRLYPERPKAQSVMRVMPDGQVEPLRFKVSDSGDKRNSDVMFDWVASRAIGDDEGKHVDMAIKPGIQDDLSVQVAMLVQLLRGTTPAAAFELDQNSVREYDYVREGTAQLNSALGSVQTIVYAAHHPGSPRTTRFWCAPSLGYVPVRVEQKRINDVEWTMQIDSLKRG
jgi:hypothetical protein